MFKLVLEKAEEPEIKLPTSSGSLKKQESSRKHPDVPVSLEENTEGVSASTLARAGFLYTGVGDTVRCFSCHAAVDRWQYGDSAIGRHIMGSD